LPFWLKLLQNDCMVVRAGSSSTFWSSNMVFSLIGRSGVRQEEDQSGVRWTFLLAPWTADPS
jgi:hypothetical protein